MDDIGADGVAEDNEDNEDDAAGFLAKQRPGRDEDI